MKTNFKISPLNRFVGFFQVSGRRFLTALVIGFLMAGAAVQSVRAQATSLNEGFEGATPDWFVARKTPTSGSYQNWGYLAYQPISGAQSFFASSADGAAGSDISIFAITPHVSLKNGATLKFKTIGGGSPAKHRLEIRLSTAGSDPGFANASPVGTFTTVLFTINPTAAIGGYPTTVTEYTVTISGLGGPTSGRLAFHYNVPGGGTGSDVLNAIWLDDVVYTLPTPAAPTDITLSNASIDENNAVNAVIGTFSTTDANIGDSHTYTISGPDASAFNINGNELRASSAFDFETQNSYEITIRATDGDGLFFEKDFVININDVNETVPNGSVAFVQPSADQNVTEGNSGFQSIPLWVELSGASTFPVVVNIPLTGTARYGNSQNPLGDYYFTAYPLTGIQFAVPNSPTPAISLTFTANGVRKLNWIIYGDNFFESNETAILTLSPQDAGVSVTGAPSRTVTILNDEAASTGTLTFAAATPSTATAEGNSGTKLVPVQVTLSGATVFPVVAQIDYAGSTALYGNTFGKDFHLTGLNTSNQLVFTANGTKTFNVVVMGDVVFEADDLVNLNLTSPTAGVTLSATNRMVTITNDDAPRLGEESAESQTALTVYPNPTRDLLNVAIQTDRDGETAEILIVDLTGKVVLSRQETLIQGQNLLTFDLSNEAAGLYQIVVSTADGRQAIKVMKQ